jgi:hypothetical protein
VRIKVFDIPEPIHKQIVRFCYGGDNQEFLALIKETDGGLDEDPGEFESGIVFPNRMDKSKAPNFWVWVKRFRGTVADHAFFVHETTHLMQYLMAWLEIPWSEDTMEPIAALHEHYFSKMLTILRKIRRREA